jgi:hypothetical protein
LLLVLILSCQYQCFLLVDFSVLCSEFLLLFDFCCFIVFIINDWIYYLDHFVLKFIISIVDYWKQEHSMYALCVFHVQDLCFGR